MAFARSMQEEAKNTKDYYIQIVKLFQALRGARIG
jgi:hypothetical protein